MDDYMSEKEQLEWIASRVKEYAPWVLGAVAAGLLGVGAVRWWQGHTAQADLDAANRYEQVQNAFAHGDRNRAMVLIEELQHAHPHSPYVDQANLAAARVFVDSNELDRAAQSLQAVVQATRDPQLALIARLRLARVQIALGAADQALATLSAAPGKAFEASYDEARGDAYYAKGDARAALAQYRAAKAARGPGVAQNDALDLKINDLSDDTSVPATASRAMAPSAHAVPAAQAAPKAQAAPTGTGK